MAFSENYVRLMGKALDNPEVAATQTGNQLVKFHLGIPSIKQGQQVTETFEVMCFSQNKFAFDEINSIVRAGKLVAVTGRLSSRESRSPKDGRTFYNYTIMANRTQTDEDTAPVQQKPADNTYNPWDERLPF